MGSGASALPEQAGLIVEPPELERQEYIKEHHKCLGRMISAVDFFLYFFLSLYFFGHDIMMLQLLLSSCLQLFLDEPHGTMVR